MIITRIQKVSIYLKAFISILRQEVTRIVIKQNPSIYIKSLQRQGVDISDDCIVVGDNIRIDVTRPSLIHIGSQTLLHNNFKILTHDFASRTFRNKYKDFIPSSGRVWIGDNVWFGENVTVLKGSYIGDNCIIGINSVVMGKIPANSVAAGCPAKLICSLDEYYLKRKKKCVKEAFDYAHSIVERYHRRPVPADFWEEFPLFVSGNEIDKYPTIPIRKQLDSAYDYWKENHVAQFATFDEFLKAAGIE